MLFEKQYHHHQQEHYLKKNHQIQVSVTKQVEKLIELVISFTEAGSVTVNATEVLVLEPSKTFVPSIESIIFVDSDIDFFNSAIAEIEISFFSFYLIFFF